ncbi:MAG: DedA family protein [FCB group bacterium]|jgi:membrane protein DedA with SNARE-associated domain|nr:DedA family protein [FCB group bacterium]
MVEYIAEWIIAIMATLGYPGLVLMMTLESMVAPVPSEIVMPFAGFLVVQGKFTFLGATLASSLGTLIGSLLSYYMGKWGGYPLVLRCGRYLLLDEKHLDWTVRWFEKRGELTIFVSRFVPVVRHLISIPAGVGNMNIIKFSIYTVIGGTIWNVILLWAGVALGERWSIIHTYSHQIDYFFIAGILAVVAWWIWKQWNVRRNSAAKVAD